MRARSLTEKRQRRADILRAAEDLWATTPYADLSMNQVASSAHLAKGTLYLYFDTKEELFLALMEGHLETWIDRAATLLNERRPGTPSQLADVLLEAGQDARSLRRLLVLLGTVLQRRVRPELLQEFRQTINARLDSLLALMPLERRQAQRALTHLYALSVGWEHLAEQPNLWGIGRESTVSVPDGLNTPDLMEHGADEEFKLAVRAVFERLTSLPGPV
ncbi:TetR family transcriptional regulator [Deinococcus humi]|nr:TetR family transcriptional regulator [Deinococcus humi]